MNSSQPKSGKTAGQENFPVASHLIRAANRPIILAFYRFARSADDVADDPTLTLEQKITRLDRMEASLLGDDGGEIELHAANLRKWLRERGISPRHAQDLLTAFRLDAVKRRYADWNDLMAYCAYSAMPVGRFVLDVHGESRALWPASDAVCAALQIINHLQDCGQDFRELDRIYLPTDLMVACGVAPEALRAGRSSAALRHCIRELAGKVTGLLGEGDGFADEIDDPRLRIEISVIHALAVRLTSRLNSRDPLSEEMHLSRLEIAGVTCRVLLQQAACVVGFGRRQVI